ncbi:hypothetical protein C8N32_1032 [Rhodovulum imhoffii]|uniref:Capsule polysaccharide biosynthesis protein n=1 Tax=Rhodovulum imhoffii TaxID=365340 RepID=A0A2T5BUG4_9RHOB|nr:hypothetical protein C8N32_1032 [Rhodovulum imhoffii]
MQLAGCVNALVMSGSARSTADLLMEFLTGALARASDMNVRNMLCRAFDICLYESFRQGENLKLDAAEDFLACLKADIAGFRECSISDTGRLSEEQQQHLGEIFQSASLCVSLLNSEHQTAAADALLDWFACLHQVGTHQVPAVLLADMIRRCTSLSRTFFDLDAQAELRQTAQDTARLWLDQHEPGKANEALADRAIALRFVLSSGDRERQSKSLQGLFDPAEENQDDESLNLATNYLSWLLETTLDPTLTSEGERQFKAISRIPSTHTYLAMAIRMGDRERGERWLAENASRQATIYSRYLEARFRLAFAEPEKSLAAAGKPLSVYAAFHEQGSPDQIERSGGNHLSAVDPLVLYNLVRTAHEASFLKDMHRFVRNCRSSHASEDNGRTIILAPNHLNFVTQLPVAAIEKARSLGAEVVSMVTGTYPHSDQLTSGAESLRDVIMPGFYYNRRNPTCAISPEWDVRPHEKKLIYKGTNYFHGVHNSLGIHFRRFSIDFENAVENRQMRINLAMIQGVHDAFEKFLSAADGSRIYVFVAIGLQAGLGSALRTLVNNSRRSNIRIVHACNGFETFDPAFMVDPVGGNAIASYHSVTDLTDHPDTPLGFRPSPDMCKKTIFRSERRYRDRNACLDQYLTKVDTRAAVARARGITPPGGRRRILVIGTILPDLSIPHDHGLAHDDIADWARHTAEIALRHDLELVIKPHPAEIDQKMGFYVSEKFADLFPDDPNISVLPYDANFHDAVLSSDLVIIWSGTSVIELTLMGRPYIACSRFAREEYPISVRQFDSRTGYEALLSGARRPQANPRGRLQAIDVIHRITTSPFREASVWPKRQLLNGHVWPPHIDPSVAVALQSQVSTLNLARRLSCFDTAPHR